MMRPTDQGLLRDADGPGPSGGLPEGLPPEIAAPETRSGRAASVSLRQERTASVEDAALMDPANQSLAEALKITFRLLQLAMVVLLGLFLLSGFQSVKENERGIRLLFGKVVRSELPPGFQFSAPYPVGELVKVDEGTKDLRLDDAFWFYQDEKDKANSIERAPAKQKLNPAGDGSVITADGNLAHTRWQVRYRRDNATKFTQNVLDADEERMVRAAVQRGVVQAVAKTNIDDLLKQTDSDESSVAMNARQIAQRMLEKMDAGIVIEQLRMIDRTPPIWVRPAFVRVQTAAQQAGQQREKAESEARQHLNATAGDAVQPLLEQIAAYELAVEKKDEAAKVQILTRIDAMLEAGADAPDGMVHASGQVARTLSEARLYRSEIVSQRQRDTETFKAKLEQFGSNPLVMVHREWEEALDSFLSKSTTQVAMLPSGTSTLELVLNPDPEIVKEMYRANKLREATEANKKRNEDLQAEKFRTRTGLQAKE